MDPKPDYSQEKQRMRAWAALARVPEFKDFFLEWVIPREISLLETSLIESCPPDEVPKRREVRAQLKNLREQALCNLNHATKPNP